ncbi:MAG TPA: hypothetical protein VND65_11680, partial [Candidatus Binatia bacterium]|nr:hypothetical protein [Candidatus Binatia bacterium]
MGRLSVALVLHPFVTCPTVREVRRIEIKNRFKKTAGANCSDMFERLTTILSEFDFDPPWDRQWKPISRPAQVAWLVFYIGFLFYAFSKHGGFLFIDTANLVVHEGGHNLFGWFGPTLGLWGGTLLQWLVP